jgi:type IV pilus assembly protein PilA
MSPVLQVTQHNARQDWQENVHNQNQNKPRGGNAMNELAMINNKKMSFRLPKLSNFSLKELNKNQKGLTLIELLAVIVIIAIIAAIAIPSIGTILDKTKANAHRSNAHMLVDASRLYVTGEGITVPVGTPLDLDLTKLNTDGYLQVIPQDPSNKGNTYDVTSKVTVTNTAGIFTYNVTLSGGGNTYITNIEEKDLDASVSVVMP